MKFSLLLSLLAFSVVACGEVARNADAATPAGDSSTVTSSPYAGMPQGLGVLDHIQANDNSGTGRICMKIRAFIFETNDDQVPKFVRETTCPPVTWSAKSIRGNTPPKLVPATKEHQF